MESSAKVSSINSGYLKPCNVRGAYNTVSYSGFLHEVRFLEHLHWCSVCDPSAYMKVKICWFGWGKWFWHSIIGQFVVAGKGRSNGVHTAAQKSLINMIWILLLFHCPIIMIGPGGLLVVVPTPLLCQFQFYGWDCKRVRNWTWMWKIFSQAHILSTAGDALRP